MGGVEVNVQSVVRSDRRLIRDGGLPGVDTRVTLQSYLSYDSLHSPSYVEEQDTGVPRS